MRVVRRIRMGRGYWDDGGWRGVKYSSWWWGIMDFYLTRGELLDEGFVLALHCQLLYYDWLRGCSSAHGRCIDSGFFVGAVRYAGHVIAFSQSDHFRQI